jgi:hypothetical protein
MQLSMNLIRKGWWRVFNLSLTLKPWNRLKTQLMCWELYPVPHYSRIFPQLIIALVATSLIRLTIQKATPQTNTWITQSTMPQENSVLQVFKVLASLLVYRGPNNLWKWVKKTNFMKTNKWVCIKKAPLNQSVILNLSKRMLKKL